MATKGRRCPMCQQVVIGTGHLFNGQLYCDSCYPLVLKSAEDIESQKTELYEFIRNLFGIDELPDSWMVSITKMLKSGKTISGIRMTLTYYTSILGYSISPGMGITNLIDKYYEETRQYAIRQQEIITANQQHVDNSKAVTIRINRPVSSKRRPTCNIEDL